MSEMFPTSDEMWFDSGKISERARILSWIEANRTAIELEPGNFLYRDHFNSQSLIAFINGSKTWQDLDGDNNG